MNRLQTQKQPPILFTNRGPRLLSAGLVAMTVIMFATSTAHAQIPTAGMSCTETAAAGLIPEFYCWGTPPTTEAYPTGDDVRPQTGPGGKWPKECTPCGGLNNLSPQTRWPNCVPIEEFDAEKCDALLDYKNTKAFLEQLKKDYQESALYGWQVSQENILLKACNSCLRTARNRRQCRC